MGQPENSIYTGFPGHLWTGVCNWLDDVNHHFRPRYRLHRQEQVNLFKTLKSLQEFVSRKPSMAASVAALLEYGNEVAEKNLPSSSPDLSHDEALLALFPKRITSFFSERDEKHLEHQKIHHIPKPVIEEDPVEEEPAMIENLEEDEVLMEAAIHHLDVSRKNTPNRDHIRRRLSNTVGPRAQLKPNPSTTEPLIEPKAEQTVEKIALQQTVPTRQNANETREAVVHDFKKPVIKSAPRRAKAPVLTQQEAQSILKMGRIKRFNNDDKTQILLQHNKFLASSINNLAENYFRTSPAG